jgi:hypothetical protein
MTATCRRRRSGGRLESGLGLALALLSGVARAQVASPGCTPWPGEPDPLPTALSSD